MSSAQLLKERPSVGCGPFYGLCLKEAALGSPAGYDGEPTIATHPVDVVEAPLAAGRSQSLRDKLSRVASGHVSRGLPAYQAELLRQRQPAGQWPRDGGSDHDSDDGRRARVTVPLVPTDLQGL